MYTETFMNLADIMINTFRSIYDFFSTDLGTSTGIELLNGVSVLESMFGAGLTLILTYTLVKWAIGIL